MSTKAIREALDLLQARHPEAYASARAELDAIEKAARVLDMYDNGKFPTRGQLEVATRLMAAIAKQER